MKVISGKKIADEILLELRKKIAEKKMQPNLAVVLVGDDKASRLYVDLKEKAAKKVGIELRKYLFPKNVDSKEIKQCLEFLNDDDDTHGIIVQLPLPKKFDQQEIINLINQTKDADGFLNKQSPIFPQAILELIKTVKKISGKTAIVVAKSEKFGEIMATELKKAGFKSEYIICDNVLNNPEQENLANADIVIIACGSPSILKKEMVKNNAIIIDGGIYKRNKKVLGDVDIKSFSKTDCSISSVPGGVGPVTVACLLKSVYNLAEKKM